jgi:hypothetical protein
LAYPDVHNVVIMGAFHTVRVLSEVGLQTAITVNARRNVGDPLTLHVISFSQPTTSAI